MKKLFILTVSLLLVFSVFPIIGYSEEKADPTITGINVLDADTQLIEILFSEPVNCKNLGYIIPVEAYPNGNRAWANLEWNGEYMYYGCIDKDGNKIGEGEESYLCVDSDNDYIYATRMVVTVGAIQNYGIFEDISGIEFKGLLDAGAFTTPDGRMIRPDETGSLYVKFSSANNEVTDNDTQDTSSEETSPEGTSSGETSSVDTPQTTESSEADSSASPDTSAKETDSESYAPSENGSNNFTGIILGAIAAAVVVTAIVIIVIKKKKS